MSDGVDKRQGREDDLPRGEAGQDAVEAAEVKQAGAVAVTEEAGEPEDENEEDLRAQEEQG